MILFLTPFIRPLSKRLEEFSRRLYGIKPISVHIERDPSIVWAGFPNWIGYSVWLPELPEKAPDHPLDWSAWAKSLGGTDASMTVLKVTITSRELSTVVIDPPRVRFEALPNGTPPKGIVATCRVGGAAVEPRRIQVNLGFGGAMWINADGEPIESVSVTLESGEVEQFYLFTTAEEGRYRWHLDLPIIVDGKRELIRIDDDGSPFVTYGLSGFDELLWDGEEWTARAE